CDSIVFILEQHDRKISSGASAQDKNGKFRILTESFLHNPFSIFHFQDSHLEFFCRNPNFCFPINDPCINYSLIGVCEQTSWKQYGKQGETIETNI
ncbi:MAG: hypothetical protein PHH26_08380, partial [Candidatus Thermoplasmatota archaeon]|nr:hypothetical protein [Candidatus Thermoplasmatota archaeon]